jgi:hypothetical protein
MNTKRISGNEERRADCVGKGRRKKRRRRKKGNGGMGRQQVEGKEDM